MATLGALRDRIIIEQPVTVADGQGGRATTWSTFATVWAAVRPWARAGGEYLQANAVGAHQDYEIEIGYRGDITPLMRVRWTPYRGSAKLLQIREVLPKREAPRSRVLIQASEVL